MIEHPMVPSVLPWYLVIDHHMVPSVLLSVGMHEDME